MYLITFYYYKCVTFNTDEAFQKRFVTIYGHKFKCCGICTNQSSKYYLWTKKTFITCTLFLQARLMYSWCTHCQTVRFQSNIWKILKTFDLLRKLFSSAYSFWDNNITWGTLRDCLVTGSYLGTLFYILVSEYFCQ